MDWNWLPTKTLEKAYALHMLWKFVQCIVQCYDKVFALLQISYVLFII